MVDQYADDLATVTHEAGHALVAVVLGRSLVRVVGHRHYALHDGEAGSCEWFPDPRNPYGECVVYVAGRIAAEGMHAIGDTPDEIRARELVGSDDDFQQARSDAWILLRRHRRALTALAHAISRASEWTLNGPAAERIIREHLWTPSNV